MDLEYSNTYQSNDNDVLLIVTVVNDVHLENACPSIDDTLSGIVILVNDVQY